nr:hypothetical protein HK105_005509 [Polyrhizophydium stewartii]
MGLLQGVGVIWFNAGPFFDDPYLQLWIPRFLLAETAAISTEPRLYYNIKLKETDTAKQSYPANFFFDDPGTDKLIVDTGSTGQTLASGALRSRVTLDRLLAPLTGANSLTGMNSFTPQGDPVVKEMTLNIFRGKSLADLGVVGATISLNPATGLGNFSLDRSKFSWCVCMH